VSKRLFLLIDLVRTNTYKNGEGDTPEWYHTYIDDRLESIRRALQYCQKNNVDTMKLNFLKSPDDPIDGDNEILQGFNFTYSWNWESTNGSPDHFNRLYHNYETIYFTGASLDACVTRTRNHSYSGIINQKREISAAKSSTIILNCCIQDFLIQKEGRRIEPDWQSVDDLYEYKIQYLKDFNYHYEESLGGVYEN